MAKLGDCEGESARDFLGVCENGIDVVVRR